MLQQTHSGMCHRPAYQRIRLSPFMIAHYGICPITGVHLRQCRKQFIHIAAVSSAIIPSQQQDIGISCLQCTDSSTQPPGSKTAFVMKIRCKSHPESVERIGQLLAIKVIPLDTSHTFIFRKGGRGARRKAGSHQKQEKEILKQSFHHHLSVISRMPAKLRLRSRKSSATSLKEICPPGKSGRAFHKVYLQLRDVYLQAKNLHLQTGDLYL